MKPEEMTDAQVADYLRKFEFQRYNQLEKVTKEHLHSKIVILIDLSLI